MIKSHRQFPGGGKFSKQHFGNYLTTSGSRIPTIHDGFHIRVVFRPWHDLWRFLAYSFPASPCSPSMVASSPRHITATSACSTDSFTCSVVRTPTSQLRCGPCQSCATLFICKFCNFPKVPAWQTGTGNYHNIVCPRCGAEYSRSGLRIPLYEDRLLPVMPVH